MQHYQLNQFLNLFGPSAPPQPLSRSLTAPHQTICRLLCTDYYFIINIIITIVDVLIFMLISVFIIKNNFPENKNVMGIEIIFPGIYEKSNEHSS